MRKRLEGRLLAAAILICRLAAPAHRGGAAAAFRSLAASSTKAILRSPPSPREARPVIGKANSVLLTAERRGRGVTCARQTLNELRWRINSTTDVAAARATLERLKGALLEAVSPHGGDANVLPQDAEGSYGPCDGEWFLKLGDSGDQLLDPGGWRGKLPPRFLGRVATPASLVAYLDRIILSDPEQEGVDRRKELNAATGVLSRLVLRGGVAGYFAKPEFRAAFSAFLERLAGSGDRLLRRVVQGPWTPDQDERSLRHLPHGALHQGTDRPLARADRHAPRHQGSTLSAGLARQRRNDEPQ